MDEDRKFYRAEVDDICLEVEQMTLSEKIRLILSY